MTKMSSPFRYPGGKRQLSRFIQYIIKMNKINDPIYCEPFSGGAGVALSLLEKEQVASVILNDYDIAIYSIWYAILNETDRFIAEIEKASVTMENWCFQKTIYHKHLSENTASYSFDLAFSAFFLNRTNRSGIISGGPIGGYKQQSAYSLDCRFNKHDISSKISKIAEYKNCIDLYNLDAVDLINKHLKTRNSSNLFIYFDPPYYVQGKRLYQNFFDDSQHEILARAIKGMDDYYWIATYDNASRIKELYSDRRIRSYQLQYSANKVRKEKELFFNSAITRVRSFDKVKFK